jgi:cysteine-rich repeat protein
VDATSPDASSIDAAPRPDAFVPDAYVPICGNGELEEGEVCDDGNTVSGDGCNATCTLQDNWDHVAAYWTNGDQANPSVACTENTMVAAWTSWSAFDSDGSCVMVRFFPKQPTSVTITSTRPT